MGSPFATIHFRLMPEIESCSFVNMLHSLAQTPPITILQPRQLFEFVIFRHNNNMEGKSSSKRERFFFFTFTCQLSGEPDSELS